MSTIVHFDISASDIERARKFYQELLGWTIEKFPNSFQKYYYINTTNQKGEPGISGGLGLRGKDWQHITNFIHVDEIDNAIENVNRLGGSIIDPKVQIPTVGFIATCYDTEGNVFGLIEEVKAITE